MAFHIPKNKLIAKELKNSTFGCHQKTKDYTDFSCKNPSWQRNVNFEEMQLLNKIGILRI